MTKTSRLVWLDLETTGLVPQEGIILEYGIVITDLKLNEIARKNWVLPWPRDVLLANLDSDYVLDMHTSNGLFQESHNAFDALANPSSRGRDVRDLMRDEIKKWLLGHTSPTAGDSNVPYRYLAGSSIHFDRSWVLEHFSELLGHVSHRMLDVSSYLVGFPDIFAKGPASMCKHRALDDLDFSISQHKRLREIVAAGYEVLMNPPQ